MFVLPSGSLNLFQTYYQVNLLDSELSYSKVSVEIRGPDNKTYLDKRLNNNGRGSFVPSKIGMHELVVKYEGHEVLAGDVHFWYWKLSVLNWFVQDTIFEFYRPWWKWRPLEWRPALLVL